MCGGRPVENVGNGDYTVDAPAEIEDDLSDVLDDATWVGDLTASTGSATRDGDTLTWTGPLAVGETAMLTYAVRVDDQPSGSGSLDNTVASTGSDANCGPDEYPVECWTSTPLVLPAPPWHRRARSRRTPSR